MLDIQREFVSSADAAQILGIKHEEIRQAYDAYRQRLAEG